jgi:signal transduction histidine kinase
LLRVLLVEDNPGDAELVRKSLTDARGPPFDLLAVDTLDEGLAAGRSRPFDVVLLDLNLPDSDGVETLRVFRAECPTAPIVVFTGTDDLETALEALRSGADDYVSKGDLRGDVLRRALRYAVERRRMVTRLEELHRETQRAAQAREELLRVVSHDLRNHVNTIELGLKLVQRMEPPEAIGQRLEAVQRASFTVRRLMGDLVDLAALEMGTLVVNPKLEDGTRLLKETHAMFSPGALQRGITLELVPTEAAVDVWADGERIVQVLGNLVGNALKFTPRGGTISMGCLVRADEVVVYVDDSGPGIPKADCARIFERFFRGSRPMGQGAGLGLAIARALVEAHGGRIWVESEPGRGTRFLFSLRRTAPPPDVA